MKILAFSGRKQSGKSSAQNFVVGAIMEKLGQIPAWTISDEGDLILQTEEGLGKYEISVPHEWNLTQVWPNVRPINFADSLKSIAVSVLGLSPEQVYGSEEQKNTLTNFLWEKMPVSQELAKQPKLLAKFKKGRMTAREVLQYYGTDIMREMYNNVWVDALFRQLDLERPQLAVIGDLRFPGEFEAVKSRGGQIVRFTLNSDSPDSHSSETSLDTGFDFDYVLDNKNLTIAEKNSLLLKFLQDYNYIPA